MVAYRQVLELGDDRHLVVQGGRVENLEEGVQVLLVRRISPKAPKEEDENDTESVLQGANDIGVYVP